jgi:very-short-patch-repair endonuclease
MERTKQAPMFYGAKRMIYQNAEVLRKNMTPAEQMLWSRLNKSQLGVRFKAQHPIDIFIADFYCHTYKIVIEIDGGIHKFQKEYDDGRTAELELLGLTVIRFSNEEVLSDVDQVVETIRLNMIAIPTIPDNSI